MVPKNSTIASLVFTGLGLGALLAVEFWEIPSHRALDDIRESIAELRYCRQHLLKA